MNLYLNRKQYRSDGIFGELIDEKGSLVAVTLEHAYADGEKFVPKVASGQYDCVRHPPNRLPYETFMLENVPEFQGHPVTGILIHVGNYNDDSIGCILLGTQIGFKNNGGQMITSKSLDAFHKFMALQDGVATFQLIVHDLV